MVGTVNDPIVLDLAKCGLTDRFYGDPPVPPHELVVDIGFILWGILVFKKLGPTECRLLGQIFVFHLAEHPVVDAHVRNRGDKQEEGEQDQKWIPLDFLHRYPPLETEIQKWIAGVIHKVCR